MEIKEINNKNYLDTFTDTLVNRKERILLGMAEDFVVLQGNNCINEKYCKDNNLEVYKSQHMGGCIVIGQGDVEFNIFRQDGWRDGEFYSKKILEFLKTKIANIDIKDNDFLVDDTYKVASYSSVNVGNGFIYTGFHFSVNVNLEHIKNICTKPMKKIPRGLSYYGITSEEILKYLEEVL